MVFLNESPRVNVIGGRYGDADGFVGSGHVVHDHVRLLGLRSELSSQQLPEQHVEFLPRRRVRCASDRPYEREVEYSL